MLSFGCKKTFPQHTFAKKISPHIFTHGLQIQTKVRHVSSICTVHSIYPMPVSASQVSVSTLVQLFGVLRSRIPGRHLPILISIQWKVHGLYPVPNQFVYISLLWFLSHSSIQNWYDTPLSLNILLTIAENRQLWTVLAPKLKESTNFGSAAADVWLNLSCTTLRKRNVVLFQSLSNDMYVDNPIPCWGCISCPKLCLRRNLRTLVDSIRNLESDNVNYQRIFWRWLKRQPWRRMLPEVFECLYCIICCSAI